MLLKTPNCGPQDPVPAEVPAPTCVEGVRFCLDGNSRGCPETGNTGNPRLVDLAASIPGKEGKLTNKGEVPTSENCASWTQSP